MDVKLVRLERNVGHGGARRAALEACAHDLVALMDADDISRPYRFQRQLEMFALDPGLHVVGGQIAEFVSTPDCPTGERIVPESDAEIKSYMRKRCPMNQMTVMLRKSFINGVGGYQDWYCNEDYYLWVRTALAGGRFANVSDILVDVRVGSGMTARRGGWRYFRSEEGIQRLMFKKGMIGIPRYLLNTLVRFGGEVLLPTAARSAAFRLFRSESGDALQDCQLVSGYRSHEPFSVALCTYGGDDAVLLRTALHSVVKQSVPPDEVVIVFDGPVGRAIEEAVLELGWII